MMSGDVQPRKRKEKRRKKDSEELAANFSSDEQLHVHKDASTGGNFCAKILFFLLSFMLFVMIGLVVFEYRGSVDDESLVPVSKWASTFDGWLESPIKHDEHADVTESGEHEHGDNLESGEIPDQEEKIADTHEWKIKADSKEEADVPKRKQEKEVSGPAKPMESTRSGTVGQAPTTQHKNQDRGESKEKVHQPPAKHGGVMNKPAAEKHEKPQALDHSEQHGSKASHHAPSHEPPAMKHDGFPSGPGETGQDQKAKEDSSSKATLSKKQKANVESAKDESSEGTLPKKQESATGPSLKSKTMPTGPSKHITSGGKSLKDKDLSSDGVHSPTKASGIGDRMEQSQKVSGSPSDVKNTKVDTNNIKPAADNTIKRSDIKTVGDANTHGKLGAARNSESIDKKVTSASGDKKNVEAKSGAKESESLNSQTDQVKYNAPNGKKLVEKKVETKSHPSNTEKQNVKQFVPKLDQHAETLLQVDDKDTITAKVHEDPKKPKVDAVKQKTGSLPSGKTADEMMKEVPVKDSTDKVRKVSTGDSIKTRTSEMKTDANSGRKKSGTNNAPSEVKHSKSSDTKASATPQTSSLKHSIKKEADSPKTQEVKHNVQSSSRNNNREEEIRPMPSSENHATRQKESDHNRPVNSNLKKPSHGQKFSSQQVEKEVAQPKADESSRTKAVPSRRVSDSETVK